MKCFKVGGVVRDRLLGLKVIDCDWVVVGSSPEEMESLGFRPVGRGFPVFLHPRTHEEYALARTERKSGHGYRGFRVQAAPSVTLEEDLRRRDLTINAMAESETGELIDPYGGVSDLRAGVLRHVSPAFKEDPLRVLRVARFAARLGFQVAPETLTLMKQLSSLGELNDLARERVWRETALALCEKYPERYFEVLESCGALGYLFPRTINSPSGLRCLRRAAERELNLEQRFTALCAGAEVPLGDTEHNLLEPLARHYPLPRDVQNLALLGCRHARKFLAPALPGGEEVLTLLQAVDARRRPERFEDLLEVCAVLVDAERESAVRRALAGWRVAAAADREVGVQALAGKGLEGAALGRELEQLRRQVVTEAVRRWSEAQVEERPARSFDPESTESSDLESTDDELSPG